MGSCLREINLGKEQKRAWFPWPSACGMPRCSPTVRLCSPQSVAVKEAAGPGGPLWDPVSSHVGQDRRDFFPDISRGLLWPGSPHSMQGKHTGQPWQLQCLAVWGVHSYGIREETWSPVMAFLSGQFLCVLKMPSHLVFPFPLLLTHHTPSTYTYMHIGSPSVHRKGDVLRSHLA